MNVKLLKTLSETASVPGQEDNMRKFVRTKLKPIVDEISVDVMGNLVGLKKGAGAKRKKVMIAGHMDEIGFIVKHIDNKGFVRLQPLGGFDPRQLFAQRVIVHGKKALKGVLTYATKPTHLLRGDEAKAAPTLGKFYVDLGMAEKAVKRSVEIGDMVTLDRTLEECGDCVVGKSLDNRIGVYVMLEAVKKVKSHKVDIYAVATVQEEVGLRGAITSSFNIAPDIAIGLDVTIAADTPGSTEDSYVSQLGDGVALKIMDGSMISHPKLVDHLKKIAKSKKIPFQMEILPFGGTDGGGMQRSHGGAVSITISIPCRYVHTVNEMANKKDIDAAVDLLAAYLECAHLGEYDFA